MPLSKLPPLPAISAGPKRPFQRVLLAEILVRLRECDPLPLSRRDLAEAYNRTSGSRVSKHLRVLVLGNSGRVHAPLTAGADMCGTESAVGRVGKQPGR